MNIYCDKCDEQNLSIQEEKHTEIEKVSMAHLGVTFFYKYNRADGEPSPFRYFKVVCKCGNEKKWSEPR